MTNKIQTMLTIALTLAVTVLLVDRIIEPAYAQDCATSWELASAVSEIENAIIIWSDTGDDCATPTDVESSVMLWCN
mgnify:CR=1 FL=1